MGEFNKEEFDRYLAKIEPGYYLLFIRRGSIDVEELVGTRTPKGVYIDIVQVDGDKPLSEYVLLQKQDNNEPKSSDR